MLLSIVTNSQRKDRLPDPKAAGVVKRILRAFSRPGDTALALFAGSGTVGESYLALGCRFILVDNNPEALRVMAKRFAQHSEIEWVNFPPDGS